MEPLQCKENGLRGNTVVEGLIYPGDSFAQLLRNKCQTIFNELYHKYLLRLIYLEL